MPASTGRTGATELPAVGRPGRARPALCEILPNMLPPSAKTPSAAARLFGKNDVVGMTPAGRVLAIVRESPARCRLAFVEGRRRRLVELPVELRGGGDPVAASRSLEVVVNADATRALLTLRRDNRVFELRMPDGVVEERLRLGRDAGELRGTAYLDGERYAALTTKALLVIAMGRAEPLKRVALAGWSLHALDGGRFLVVAADAEEPGASNVHVLGLHGSSLRSIVRLACDERRPAILAAAGRVFVVAQRRTYELESMELLERAYRRTFRLAVG